MSPSHEHAGHDFFTDRYAQMESLLSRIDPRVKVLFVSSVIILDLFAQSALGPFVVAVLMVWLLRYVHGVPFRILLTRLGLPLLFAAVIVVVSVVVEGTTPLFSFQLFGWELTGHWEGLATGWLLVGRVLGGVSAALLLAFTTPLNKLIAVGHWMRIPATVIELMVLAYRYIFVLFDEAHRIRAAQTIRLGYSNRQRAYRSLSVLMGMLLVRAYDRADKTYQAMLSRGYQGTFPVVPLAAWDREHVLQILWAGVLLAALIAITFAAPALVRGITP